MIGIVSSAGITVLEDQVLCALLEVVEVLIERRRVRALKHLKIWKQKVNDHKLEPSLIFPLFPLEKKGRTKQSERIVGSAGTHVVSLCLEPVERLHRTDGTVFRVGLGLAVRGVRATAARQPTLRDWGLALGTGEVALEGRHVVWAIKIDHVETKGGSVLIF
jgi:hypothetical protein